MDINLYYADKNEKPLDRIVDDGGFCKIFRTIGVIGDSLSSGEFESFEEGIKGYHDFYEYSWGQFMARALGSKVYNFSRGGMTTKAFIESFGSQCGAFEYEKLCQAYIIALGINDHNKDGALGDPYKSKELTIWDDDSFMTCYGNIIKAIKRKQPKAKFFLVTMPDDTGYSAEKIKKRIEWNEAIRALAEVFDNTYIIDLEKYAPTFDEKFRKTFFLGHMTPTGYILIAKMVMSYIDWIIRNNPSDFDQVGFIGTPYSYNEDK